MTYRGEVKGGVIVLDGAAHLAEGTIVSVMPLAQATTTPDDALRRIGEFAVDTGITDLATNVDHYLYGHPKVQDGG
jgi:uncharacterized protein YjeT (DUF2065 family)